MKLVFGQSRRPLRLAFKPVAQPPMILRFRGVVAPEGGPGGPSDAVDITYDLTLAELQGVYTGITQLIISIGGTPHLEDAQGAIEALYYGFSYISDLIQQIGNGGSAVTRSVAKTAHGLSVGNWVRETGGSDSGVGSYVLAQADSLDHAQAVWVVVEVADADNFKLLLNGYVTNMSSLSPSMMYYLSPTTPGAITTTKPTAAGQVIKPVMFAVGSTRGYVSGDFVAEVIGQYQPGDTDLTAIAAEDSSQSGVIASDGGGWFRKTYAALKTALNLGNVDNTSDANKPVSSATQTALNAKQNSLGYTPENAANKNTASGYAGLDPSGKVLSSQLPALAITDTYVAASQAAMLALSGAETGDVAVRTDLNKTFILKGTTYSVLADWQELLTPTSAVTSVNARAGAVTGLAEQTSLDATNAAVALKYTKLIPTAVKTANYTMGANELVPVNTTSGAVQVTLPTTPADGTLAAVKNIIQGGTNVMTVVCGGSATFNRAGGATTNTLALLAQSSIMQYQASTDIWFIIADDVPLSQLDARYATKKPRVYSATSAGTLTPEKATYDSFTLTAQAAALTIANHVTSTPGDFEKIQIRILDNGTPQTIAYGTNYVARSGITPPTTTVANKLLELGYEWNAAISKYNLIAMTQEV